MDNELNSKSKAINQFLDSLKNQLELLNDENFGDKFQLALETMMIIQKLKNDLIEKYGMLNLIKYNPNMFIKAKQIEETYDNTIRKFGLEISRLEKEISSLNGRKKIVNYIR